MMKVLFHNRTGTGQIKAESLSEFIQKVRAEFLQTGEDYDMLIKELWDRDKVQLSREDIRRMLSSSERTASVKEDEWRSKGRGKGGKGGNQRKDDEEEQT